MSQTVRRAIEILEFVSEAPRTQTEVGVCLGVHRSTALRLLETLAEGGLVRRMPDGRYAVGYRLAGLAQKAVGQFGPREVAAPHLRELGRRCGHTIHLAALDGQRIVYADKVDAAGMLRLYSEIGKPVTVHTAGVAKAILAFLPPERVGELLAGCDFQAHTATTITDRDRYLAVLDQVRARGWAVDDGELEDYISCIAAPVRDATGSVVGAVSVTALRARAEPTALERDVLGDLLATTTTISKELGWHT